MSITTSDEYFAVHIDTPMGRMITWDSKHPWKPGHISLPRVKRYNAERKAAAAKAREDYTRDYAILKEAGLHKEQRFQYEETAKKWAAHIETETGVKVRVSRQFDLGFGL